MSQKNLIEWMLDKMIEHNGILPMEAVNEASEMYQEQLSAAYTEGFKRCNYIRELSEGKLFFPNEETPDDFETYFQKTYAYGEDQDRS
jgi:hypothetical protein